jgi:hypothetical protein
MGAFLVNFHVRTSSIEQVSESLQQLPIENAWIAGPQNEWISFWEEQASLQDTGRIRAIAQHISRALEAPVIAFLVHDSDVLCYWLYDLGKQLDEYNSCPCYGEDDESIDEESLAANCTLLAAYCKQGIEPAKLEEIMVQWTRSDRAAGQMPRFVVVEEALVRLAPLLGLSESVVSTDYNDFGRDVSPQEMGAVWAGTGEPPEQDATTEEILDRTLRLKMPPAPLHEAAVANDITAIEHLVAEGADVNEIPCPYTVTALAMAAGQGRPATIRRLVELGADLHKKTHEGATPLRLAVQAGNVENIRTLVDLGADIDDYDPRTGTLLHWALMCAAHESFRTLLELGADSERKSPTGHTPLSCVQVQLAGLRRVQSMAKGAAMALLGEQIRTLEEFERILMARSHQEVAHPASRAFLSSHKAADQSVCAIGRTVRDRPDLSATRAPPAIVRRDD